MSTRAGTRAPRGARRGVVVIPQSVRPVLERIGDVAQAQGLDAYAVGGCVRDWQLGMRTLTDLDVCVVGDGIAFAKSIARECAASMKSHMQFGTATLEVPLNRSIQPRTPKGRGGDRAGTVHAGEEMPRVAGRAAVLRLDVATCRKERYTEPAAYPRVAPGTLRDDLLRRDFTVNTMAVALTGKAFGTLIDPYGGLRDLRTRRLRILHQKSFLDDPSRILRAARFVSRLGLRVEKDTARCMRRAIAQGMLLRLNRGRLKKELDRFADEPDPTACLSYLARWLAQGLKAAGTTPSPTAGG